MKLNQSPCQSSALPETQIKYVDENTINIDGEDYPSTLGTYRGLRSRRTRTVSFYRRTATRSFTLP